MRWPQYNQERDGPRGEEGFYNERARERETGSWRRQVKAERLEREREKG